MIDIWIYKWDKNDDILTRIIYLLQLKVFNDNFRKLIENKERYPDPKYTHGRQS